MLQSIWIDMFRTKYTSFVLISVFWHRLSVSIQIRSFGVHAACCMLDCSIAGVKGHRSKRTRAKTKASENKINVTNLPFYHWMINNIKYFNRYVIQQVNKTPTTTNINSRIGNNEIGINVEHCIYADFCFSKK